MNNETRRVLFRTDASVTRGIGHVMRCHSLADELVTRGFSCRFAGGPETLALMPSSKHDFLPVNDTQSVSEVFPQEVDSCEVLVVDHYDLDWQFETACREKAKWIVVIDDLANRHHDADILVEPTANRDSSDYEGLVPPQCDLLVGGEYALLRRVFSEIRDETLRRRSDVTGLSRLVVSIGGMDHLNVTAVVLDGIAMGVSEMAVDVILAAGAPFLSDIEKRANDNICLYVGVQEEIASIFSKADLAIGAPGGTSWERCCLGLPALLTTTADNQVVNARQLTEAGAAVDLGPARKLLPQAVMNEINLMANEPAKLKRMSRFASALCDGLGARRVADAIVERCVA